MIEQQTIDGRKAVVAYLTRDFAPATKDAFDYAKVLFDDGEMVILSGDAEDSGALDAQGFNRHRMKQQRQFGRDPEGDAEAAGFNKHRFKQQRPIIVYTLSDEPPVVVEGEVRGNVNEIPVKLQLVAWQKAIIVIDASEIMVRDLIERELAGKTGTAAEYRPATALASVDRLMVKIADIRVGAIKTAFRLLRDRFNNVMVLDTSLAKWAAYFAAIDLKAIDAAIRAGLISGEDNTEIARRVVGSMALNGVDGVTEYTRNKIAHLGRAAIKSANLRKAGQTKGLFDGTAIE